MTSLNGVANDSQIESYEVIDRDGRIYQAGDIAIYENSVSLHQGKQTQSVENPWIVNPLGTSIKLEKVSLDQVDYFPYSGRDYSLDQISDVKDKIERRNFSFRAPSAFKEDGDYLLFDGQSYYTAAINTDVVEDAVWVREFDIMWEQALDKFIDGHFPNPQEMDLQDNHSGIYSDEEILKSLKLMSEDDRTFFPQFMEKRDTLAFHAERMDIEDMNWIHMLDNRRLH